MKSICVYCGSSDEVPAKYFEAARAMGAAIAERGFELVYGGGSTGLMGAVADAALAAGGQVTGVLPENFNKPELAHAGLTRLELVTDMHARKARMIALADAFIAMPGGFGTLEEVFEALTWAQIGLHTKPIGFLNAYNYYDQLLQFLEHANQEGFTFWEHKQLHFNSADPAALLDALVSYQLPNGLDRWLQR